MLIPVIADKAGDIQFKSIIQQLSQSFPVVDMECQ